MTCGLAVVTAMLLLASPALRASEAKEPPPSEPGFLGVLLQVVDEDVARAVGLDAARGVFVARVLGDSPAAQAGIRDGDVILKLDGEPVADRAALIRRISGTRPGKRVQVTVFRDREDLTVDVTVGRRPESLTRR
jgi:serine protease Do